MKYTDVRHSIKIAALFFLFSAGANASSENDIQAILDQQEAPSGVIFEVVSLFEGTLELAIPKITNYSSALRKRFPNLSIAIVSHGNEQFSLTKNNKTHYNKLHKQVKKLTNDDDIPVHICATYAERKNVAESAFPDYINVAASGPSQIANYRELGYILIKLDNW